MNNVARLSVIFSLIAISSHFPFPHIRNKTSILDGMIMHAITATNIKSASQSLANMIWKTAQYIYLVVYVSNQIYYVAYCTPSSPCIPSQIIHTNRANLIVASDRTAQDILSPRSIWYVWWVCSFGRCLVVISPNSIGFSTGHAGSSQWWG